MFYVGMVMLVFVFTIAAPVKNWIDRQDVACVTKEDIRAHDHR